MAVSKRTRDGAVCIRPSRVMPLDQFPAAKQAEIEELVSAPTPPPKWRGYGPPDSHRPVAYMVSRAWHEWHWQRGFDPDRGRQSLSPTLRSLVIARDGYICQICETPVDPSDVHIDHIYPVSKGGRDILSNLQVTHSVCNLKKGARI